MVNLSQLSREKIQSILDNAVAFSNGKREKVGEEVFISNLFFENSTRTRMSFELAERKLGLQVVPFDAEKSSINKGETLYDTVKTLESIGLNLLVIRHKQNEFYKNLTGIKIPIINAGDGTGNHPSQSILDVMTIEQEFGKIEGLKVAIVGDIKHSRVANSTTQVLRKLGAKVFHSGPREWFDEGHFMNGTYQDLDELIPEVDVLILLRIQHERHVNKIHISDSDYLKKYGLTNQRSQRMKESAIIMHPGPINRGVEIESDLVEAPQSRIFKQMQNGTFARMAILKFVLERAGYNFEEVK